MKENNDVIATNPSAYVQYFIEETIEAGIALTGTEIKSLRQKSANLKEGYVEIVITPKKMISYLCCVHIAPYGHGNIWNHLPERKRPLLMHRRQIRELHEKLSKKGVTIVPIKMYFSKRKAKVLLGIGKGKKSFDKREDLKKKEADRAMAFALKKSRQKM